MWTLISVCEREIVTENFRTYEEAYAQMKKELLSVGQFKNLQELEQYHTANEDFSISSFSAWSNIHNVDNDWKIVKVADKRSKDELPKIATLSIDKFLSEEEAMSIAEEAVNKLSDDYGFCINGYEEINFIAQVKNIDWDTSE